MTQFYLMSDEIMLLISLYTWICVVVQIVNILFSWRRFGHDLKRVIENVTEVAILLCLFTDAYLIAETVYEYDEGYIITGTCILLRWTVFTIVFGCSIFNFFIGKKPEEVLTAAAVLITVPMMESVLTAVFPILFILSLTYFCLRGIYLAVKRYKQINSEISASSVKEAIDALHTGIMYGKNDGKILLQNHRMQKLMVVLTGELYRNGREFLKCIEEGRIDSACSKHSIGGQPAFSLPDETVWMFTLHSMKNSGKKSILLTAADVTERWNAAGQLEEQNKELEERNRKLHEMLDNLDEICRTEERIRVKNRIHDILGQRISILMRLLREHREPDDKLLKVFEKNLLYEITNISTDTAQSTINTIVQAFSAIGVSINVKGQLPGDAALAHAFSDITRESVTNAVRHGYAANIDICFTNENGEWKLEVENDGIQAEGFVKEGGGLKSIRSKADELGGHMSIRFQPAFRLTVTVPEGGGV